MQNHPSTTAMWPALEARPVRAGVVVWVAVLFIGVTMALNRQFAYLQAGEFYISEIVLGALLVGSALACLRDRRWGVTWDSPSVPVGFFLLAGMISLLRGVGQYGFAAWKDSVLCFYATAFFIGRTAFRSRRHIWMMFCAIVMGGIIATGLVMFNLMPGGNEWLSKTMPRRVAVATNLTMELSVILCMCLGALLPVRVRRVWAVLSIVQVLLIVVGRVRTAWASLVFTVLLLGVLHWGRRSPIVALRNTFVRGSRWAALAVGVVWAFWPMLSLSVRGRLTSVWWEGVSSFTRPPEQSASYENGRWRLALWGSAADEIADHPLWGIPFGQVFVPQQVAEKGYHYDTDKDNEVHNSLISVALRMGLVGLGCFLWAVWRVLKAVYRWGAVSPCQSDCRLAAAINASLMLILMHSMFCVALEGPYMALPFWLLAGMGTALSRMRHAWPPTAPAPQPVTSTPVPAAPPSA